jgi:membrane-associated phospholipid phosphatase
MSDVYMIFFAFIPGTLASALVFSRNLKAGIFYVTAQSINWLLAAGSYFLLPSLGPIYADPATFAHLPDSGVTYLQELLLTQRIEFLTDPVAGTAQSIAAFTSLHVSIFFTAALAAHLLGLARSVRIVAWILVALTTAATIYLGWHYVVDDLGGVAIAVTAIVLARALTGLDLRAARATSASRSAPG